MFGERFYAVAVRPAPREVIRNEIAVMHSADGQAAAREIDE
jgi:hypothetical protein